jgi:hypothetical protein
MPDIFTFKSHLLTSLGFDGRSPLKRSLDPLRDDPLDENSETFLALYNGQWSDKFLATARKMVPFRPHSVISFMLSEYFDVSERAKKLFDGDGPWINSNLTEVFDLLERRELTVCASMLPLMNFRSQLLNMFRVKDKWHSLSPIMLAAVVPDTRSIPIKLGHNSVFVTTDKHGKHDYLLGDSSYDEFDLVEQLFSFGVSKGITYSLTYYKNKPRTNLMLQAAYDSVIVGFHSTEFTMSYDPPCFSELAPNEDINAWYNNNFHVMRKLTFFTLCHMVEICDLINLKMEGKFFFGQRESCEHAFANLSRDQVLRGSVTTQNLIDFPTKCIQPLAKVVTSWLECFGLPTSSCDRVD